MLVALTRSRKHLKINLVKTVKGRQEQAQSVFIGQNVRYGRRSIKVLV